MLSGAPEILEKYFDYEALARDLFLESYTEINGFVFVD
jgi:antirestriction protein